MTFLSRAWEFSPETKGKAGGAVKESLTTCPWWHPTLVGLILVGTPRCEDVFIISHSHATKIGSWASVVLHLQDSTLNAQKNHCFVQIYSLTHITALFKCKTIFWRYPSPLLLWAIQRWEGGILLLETYYWPIEGKPSQGGGFRCIMEIFTLALCTDDRSH